ncbi:unnamed protein product [Lathyrus sativus]|nr:unnamed protein product [Lathyrus sativus]CAK8078095.1 unnamed protein product [Lathyrus sativus]
MNHLLQKNLMLFTSSRSPLQSCTLLVRFQLSKLLSSSPIPYSHRKRHGNKEYRNVRVSVWWDFETCNLPSGVSISKVKPAVTNAVRANGIKGPVHITAFGDVCQLSRPNQEALPFSGIHLIRFLKIPKGGENSDDISRTADLMNWVSENPLMYWVSQNPPPAHLFLISGDRDFAGILHLLRIKMYNILLASPGNAPDVLCSAATMMWQWTSILKGEDLTGKHLNHPPDGQFGSWYGNSKVPLENPFWTSILKGEDLTGKHFNHPPDGQFGSWYGNSKVPLENPFSVENPFSAAEESTSSQNIHVTEINEPSSDLKVGVGLKVRSMKFSDDEIVRSTDISPKVREKYTTLGKLLAGTDHTNKHEDQPRKEVDDHSPYSSAVDDSLVDKRPDVHPETYSKRSTFFSWIKSWWPFQKSNVKADDSTFYQKKVTRLKNPSH